MARSITRKFYADPGHGWLAVPYADLVELGIKEEISTYSYMTGTTVFLEEDRDASIYMTAAKAKGWTVKIKQHHTNNDSRIRTYGSYDPHWIDNPIGQGTRVYVPGIKRQATVKVEVRNGWLIETDAGMRYKIPTRNPFAYVKPADSDPANDEALLEALNS